MKIVLWILQVLLAALFLALGGFKFAITAEAMNAQAPIPLPGPFIHFIGACELLGVVGLILPSALRIKPALTPLAAAGLAILAVGAAVIAVMGGQYLPASLDLVAALLCAFVAYGRWRLAPIPAR